ncbi:hypothetical protein K438DRAFT_1764411 [Mycena galopus ATCC 62051]|nr:hypothetical protein K438DRAFT_1764411 [Mycena galopus ATCC 62051]
MHQTRGNARAVQRQRTLEVRGARRVGGEDRYEGRDTTRRRKVYGEEWRKGEKGRGRRGRYGIERVEECNKTTTLTKLIIHLLFTVLRFRVCEHGPNAGNEGAVGARCGIRIFYAWEEVKGSGGGEGGGGGRRKGRHKGMKDDDRYTKRKWAKKNSMRGSMGTVKNKNEDRTERREGVEYITII